VLYTSVNESTLAEEPGDGTPGTGVEVSRQLPEIPCRPENARFPAARVGDADQQLSSWTQSPEQLMKCAAHVRNMFQHMPCCCQIIRAPVIRKRLEHSTMYRLAAVFQQPFVKTLKPGNVPQREPSQIPWTRCGVRSGVRCVLCCRHVRTVVGRITVSERFRDGARIHAEALTVATADHRKFTGDSAEIVTT